MVFQNGDFADEKVIDKFSLNFSFYFFYTE